MKRYLLILAWFLAGIVIFASQGWRICAEDTVDSGIRDSNYVELYGPDQNPSGYPYFYTCPKNDTCYAEGEYVSQMFDIRHTDSVITEISLYHFDGPGVENVHFVNLTGVGTSHVTGNVAYTVVNLTQSGGVVAIIARDGDDHSARCDFFISLMNACPQAPNDNGICDTMNVEVWPADVNFPPPTGYARIAIYVTHDNPNPVDSIGAFIIPLCYTHSNASMYCSLSAYQNGILYNTLDRKRRSIFRHLPSYDNPVVHNWMMDLIDAGHGEEWNGVILDLDGISHFWLTLIPSGAEDMRFGTGAHTLLATMTFKLQDSTMICIDTCFWPPSSRLAFSRADAITYIPRHNLPLCHDFRICPNCGPVFTACPGTQTPPANGHYSTGQFAVNFIDCVPITSLTAGFQGSGVENIQIFTMKAPPRGTITGWVEYDVTDRCKPGGTVTLTAVDECEAEDYCTFDINIQNDPPVLSVPDSIFAITDLAAGFPASASDAEGDPVNIALNAFWFIEDSLKTPVNPPSYRGNNPGSFNWTAAISDMGRWIASLLATDTCGKSSTSHTTIIAGMTSCGDCTNDSIMDVADVVYLLNYLFKGGTAPNPLCRGDVNCSGLADVGDVILLINYLYKGGTAPCFGCCG